MSSLKQYGCKMCWGEDAGEAWDRVIRNTRHALLVDETHFIVSILTCPICAQAFLKVTTETIDWYGGEDPIDRVVIPIDAEERDRLKAASPLTNDILEGIGPGRRSLRYAWPAGAEPSVFWSAGVVVGVHD